MRYKDLLIRAARNMLVYSDSNGYYLKLADFGLACKVQDNELLYHLCGTPTYVAPEVLAEFGWVFRLLNDYVW